MQSPANHKPFGRGKGPAKGKQKSKKGVIQGRRFKNTCKHRRFKLEIKALHHGTHWTPSSCQHQNLHRVLLLFGDGSFQQCGSGMGRAFEESLPRSEHHARGHQDANRKSRSREWKAWHKELAPSDKVSWKSQKTLAEVSEQQRPHRSQWMAHLAAGIQMWEAQLKDFRKHQTLLTGQSCWYRDYRNQQDYPTAQQSSSRWHQSTQSACPISLKIERSDGRCCRQGRRCHAAEATRSAEALCRISWTGICECQAQRDD